MGSNYRENLLISAFFVLIFYTEVSAPSPTVQLPQQKPMEVPVAMNNPLPFPSSMLAPISRPTTVPHDTDEDEGLKHFEQVSWYAFNIKICHEMVGLFSTTSLLTIVRFFLLTEEKSML